MANKIQLKRSISGGQIPSAGELVNTGEIFINTPDEKVYVSKGDGTSFILQPRYKKTSSSMSGTTLVISDSDIAATSGITWTASSTPNGFIQVEVITDQITFTSTASETCSFTYYIFN